jgi:glycosyltransferase involved in cell wall biosynthesis
VVAEILLGHPAIAGVIFLVERGELAQAIEELLADRALRARMGRAGRQLAVERFSQERVFAATWAVYQSVIARASGARVEEADSTGRKDRGD